MKRKRCAYGAFYFSGISYVNWAIMTLELKIGDRVEHLRFGQGIVVRFSFDSLIEQPWTSKVIKIQVYTESLELLYER
jgi:hypothetical protein